MLMVVARRQKASDKEEKGKKDSEVTWISDPERNGNPGPSACCRRKEGNLNVSVTPLECIRRIFEWEILPQVADFSGGEKSSACGRISHVFGVRSAHIFTIEIFSYCHNL